MQVAGWLHFWVVGQGSCSRSTGVMSPINGYLGRAADETTCPAVEGPGLSMSGEVTMPNM